MRIRYNFFVLLAVLFVFALNSFAQWEVVNQSETTDHLNAVIMVSSTAWAVGDNGTIIKSADGGSTWTALNSETSEDLEDVYFHNENEGIAVGVDGIFQTQDGGQSWSQLDVEGSDYSRAVSFANEDMGVVVDISGNVFLTSDGGDSWTQTEEDISNTAGIRDAQFVSDSIAYTVTSRNVFKSTDGCETWAQITSTDDVRPRIAAFYDENNGIVFGSNSYITADGGENWTELETLGTYNNGYLVNSQLYFAVGPFGNIYRSTDSGQSWTEQESGIFSRLNAVYFVDENNGIVVGDGGVIVRTDNGGVTSVNSEENVPAKFNLSQNYPNPFNPSTTISYSIPEQSNVSLNVYDALGKEVAELINTEKAAGNYEVNFDASKLSSGIYFYTLKTNEFFSTRKMLLIK